MKATELLKAIRAEIERRMKEYDSIIANQATSMRAERSAWKWAECKSLLSFLDTLQEEQPSKDLDVTDFSKPLDPDVARAIADNWWNDNEQTSKDLEEAAEKYRRESYKKAIQPNIDGPMTEYGGSIKDAFKAGAQWQKEQMLKDAVDGYVNYYEDSGGILMAEAQVGCPYHLGDKVKIIIVKEDEQ